MAQQWDTAWAQTVHNGPPNEVSTSLLAASVNAATQKLRVWSLATDAAAPATPAARAAQLGRDDTGVVLEIAEGRASFFAFVAADLFVVMCHPGMARSRRKQQEGAGPKAGLSMYRFDAAAGSMELVSSLHNVYGEDVITVGPYIIVDSGPDSYELTVVDTTGGALREARLGHRDPTTSAASIRRAVRARHRDPDDTPDEDDEDAEAEEESTNGASGSDDDGSDDEDGTTAQRFPAVGRRWSPRWGICHCGGPYVATLSRGEFFRNGAHHVNLIDLSKMARVADIPTSDEGASRVLVRGGIAVVDYGDHMEKEFWDLRRRRRVQHPSPEQLAPFASVFGTAYSYLNEALIFAVARSASMSTVEALLKSGADASCVMKGHHYRTALGAAYHTKQVRTAELLMAHGADPAVCITHPNDSTVAKAAEKDGATVFVKLFGGSGVDEEANAAAAAEAAVDALILALAEGAAQRAVKAFKAGADPFATSKTMGSVLEALPNCGGKVTVINAAAAAITARVSASTAPTVPVATYYNLQTLPPVQAALEPVVAHAQERAIGVAMGALDVAEVTALLEKAKGNNGKPFDIDAPALLQGRTLLSAAVTLSHLAFVKLILAAGARVDVDGALATAAAIGHPFVLPAMVAAAEAQDPGLVPRTVHLPKLFAAVDDWDEDGVREAAAAGADINATLTGRQRLLAEAASKRVTGKAIAQQVSMLRLLVNLGADTSACAYPMADARPTSQQQTALEVAGTIEAQRYLATVASAEDRLVAAVKASDAGEVTRLIEGGANVNYRSYRAQQLGFTPLRWCALIADSDSKSAIVAALLAAGADPGSRDDLVNKSVVEASPTMISATQKSKKPDSDFATLRRAVTEQDFVSVQRLLTDPSKSTQLCKQFDFMEEVWPKLWEAKGPPSNGSRCLALFAAQPAYHAAISDLFEKMSTGSYHPSTKQSAEFMRAAMTDGFGAAERLIDESELWWPAEPDAFMARLSAAGDPQRLLYDASAGPATKTLPTLFQYIVAMITPALPAVIERYPPPVPELEAGLAVATRSIEPFIVVADALRAVRPDSPALRNVTSDRRTLDLHAMADKEAVAAAVRCGDVDVNGAGIGGRTLAHLICAAACHCIDDEVNPALLALVESPAVDWGVKDDAGNVPDVVVHSFGNPARRLAADLVALRVELGRPLDFEGVDAAAVASLRRDASSRKLLTVVNSARYQSNVDDIRALIAAGADPNFVDRSEDRQLHNGGPALMEAATSHAPAAVFAALISGGAAVTPTVRSTVKRYYRGSEPKIAAIMDVLDGKPLPEPSLWEKIADTLGHRTCEYEHQTQSMLDSSLMNVAKEDPDVLLVIASQDTKDDLSGVQDTHLALRRAVALLPDAERATLFQGVARSVASLPLRLRLCQAFGCEYPTVLDVVSSLLTQGHAALSPAAYAVMPRASFGAAVLFVAVAVNDEASARLALEDLGADIVACDPLRLSAELGTATAARTHAASPVLANFLHSYARRFGATSAPPCDRSALHQMLETAGAPAPPVLPAPKAGAKVRAKRARK